MNPSPSMPAHLVEPALLWVQIFVLACCAMFICCLYHAIKMAVCEFRISAERREPLPARIAFAVTQPALLLFFAAFYYVLESLAHAWTPYYVYTILFPDGIPFLCVHTASSPVWIQPIATACTDHALALAAQEPRYNEIPVSVLLMESALTYAAMWTALMLWRGPRAAESEPSRRRYWLVPCWAALFVVTIDALLDPVVAAKYDCKGVARGDGIGFWHWFIPDAGEPHQLAAWFGVPVFNYAAWWAGPMIAISFAMFLQYLRGALVARVCRQSRGREEPSPFFGLFAIVLLAFYALIQVSRLYPEPKAAIWIQWAVLVCAIAVTAVLVFRQIRYFEVNVQADWSLWLPPLVFFALPCAALFYEGFFLEIPGLILVGPTCLLLVVLFTLWPYEKSLRRLVASVIDLDRSIRLAYFGFSSLLILLGAASVAFHRPAAGEIRLDLTKWPIGGLLTAALAFHIFAYVLNDYLDLEVDRTQSRRELDPLVRGAMQPEAALALSLVQVPAAFLVAFLLNGGGQNHGNGAASYAVLAGGFALMFVYNRFGKRSYIPPVTDAAQALAWSALPVFAALIVDPHRGSQNWILVWTLVGFGSGFILLISGVHGGLRDLANDLRHGCRTTVRWLGAEFDSQTGAVVSNWKIATYAYVVQTAMFVLPVVVLLTASAPGSGSTRGVELALGERWMVGGILAVHFVVCSVLLFFIVRPREPERDRYISVHPLLLMQTPLLAFAPFLYTRTLFFILLVTFYGPLLFNRHVLRWILRFTHPRLAIVP